MEGFDVVAVFVLAVVAGRVIYVLGMKPALETMKSEGRIGIIGFELMWTRQRARDVLRQLGEDGRRAARVALWWDFPFLVSYVLAGGVLAWAASSHASAGRGWPGWSDVAAFGGWAIVVAGLLDVVENAALLLLLRRSGPESDGGGDDDDGGGGSGGGVNLPLIASVAAAVKFALLPVGALAVVTVALLFHAAPPR